MAATINPRDIQILGTTPRMVGVGLPPNIVVDPDSVDGLGLMLNGIKRVWISATSQIFQIAKNDTVSPSSITLTANVRNLTATPTLTIVPGSGTMSVVPALTAGVFSFTESQLTSNTVTLRLSLTEDSVTYTDDFTFVKVREGDDSLNGYLTNEAHTVPADHLGNVTSYAGASGTFNLLLGTLDVRTASTFAVAPGGNPDGLTVAITASGSNAGNYTVTGGFPTNKDTVTIRFNATFGTTVFPKVLTLTKSKAGQNGSGSITWSTRGGVVVNGSTAVKSTGVSDWNGEAASVQAFAGGAYISFSAAATAYSIAVGLNTDPTSAPDYQSIDYAIYIQGDGNLYAMESGSAYAYGTYAAGDRFEVRYFQTGPSSAKVIYYKNGASLREVSAPAGLLLYADSCFYHVGATVNNLVFGPTGASGANGVRGSKQFYVGLSGSTATWSDALAASAASVDGGPVLNDQVTQYNNSVGFSQTRFWNGSTWVTVDAVIDGNLLVSGTVGASKVVVNAGTGTNVWFDPNYADSSAWQVALWGVLPQRVVLTDGITSGTAMRSPVNSNASVRGSFRTPVVVGKKYRVSAKVRKSSTANGSFYLRVDRGTGRVGAYSEDLIGVEAAFPSASWQEFSGVWTATAPWASPVVILNDSSTAGYMEAQDIRIEEMNAAGLIVQGGIVADQIDSRGLSIKDSSGNTILAAGSALPIGYAPQGTINNLIGLDFWRNGAAIPWQQNAENNQLIGITPGAWPWFGGPKGGNDTVWYCGEVTGDGQQGGGWNNAPFAAPLDPTKTYRFVVPIRRISGTGSSYWGVANVCDLNTTAINGNPYFASSDTLPTDRWYLFIGYVFPFGSTGNSHDSAGIWDCKTGLKFSSGLNYNHAPAGVSSHRAYQYYASAGAEQVFGRPVVNLVDGTEPSLRDYFEPGAVLNDALVPSITAAQSTANSAVATANSANLVASNAQASANAANAAIANIGSDSILSRGEKPQVVQDWLTVDSERAGIVAQANTYGIVTERDNYNVAWGNLNSYLSGLSPAYNDTSQDTPINGASFRLYWVQLYDARQTLLNKIADEAGKRAVWASVTGSGRPADNATVGATFGVDINGQITSGNVSTYIANAAIGTAQISELNASKIVAGTITTDKIQVGAASAAQGGSTVFPGTGIPVGSTSFTLPLTDVTSLVSTGAPLTVTGYVDFTIILNSTSVTSISLKITMKDGGMQLDETPDMALAVKKIAGGAVASTRVPLHAFWSPSAANRVIRVGLTSEWRDANNFSVATSGTTIIALSVKVQENKV